MQPITGFLSYFQQRLGSTGLLLILVLAVAAIVAVSVVMGSLATAADPVQVAPLRWGGRHV